MSSILFWPQYVATLACSDAMMHLLSSSPLLIGYDMYIHTDNNYVDK